MVGIDKLCVPSVEVLLSLIKFPKVFPPSVLVLITGLSAPVSFVHHATATVLPATFIFTLLRTTVTFGFVLGGLRTITVENVFPPSVLFVKNMASPWRAVLALFHAV